MASQKKWNNFITREHFTWSNNIITLFYVINKKTTNSNQHPNKSPHTWIPENHTRIILTNLSLYSQPISLSPQQRNWSIVITCIYWTNNLPNLHPLFWVRVMQVHFASLTICSFFLPLPDIAFCLYADFSLVFHYFVNLITL